MNLLPLGKKFIKVEEELIADLGKAYRQVFADLYDAGCRSLQLDDCTWPVIFRDDTLANKDQPH